MIIEHGTYDDFKYCVLYGWRDTFICLASELVEHFKGELLESWFTDSIEADYGLQNTLRIQAPPSMQRHHAFLRLESYGFRKPVPMELAVVVYVTNPKPEEIDFWLEKSTPRMGKYFRYAKKLEQLKLNEQEKRMGSTSCEADKKIAVRRSGHAAHRHRARRGKPR